MTVFASPVAAQLIPGLVKHRPAVRAQVIPAWGEGETVDEAVANLCDAVLDYATASGQGDALARLLLPGGPA